MIHLGIISIMADELPKIHLGVTNRAIERGLIKIGYWNPRDWAKGEHRQIDDKPYGGGPGMVMMYEPLRDAITYARDQMPKDCRTIYLSPQGRQIKQSDLNRLVKEKQSLLFLAGRYEGIDERIVKRYVDEEWSLGDFVLSGGE